jgi:hypothetical protein
MPEKQYQNQGTEEDSEIEIKNSGTNISSMEFALMVLVAAGKDSLDGGATLSVVGMPFTPVFNVGAVLILWLWCMTRLKKFPTKRFMGSTLLEFIPLVNALPFWTAFIIMLYIQQNHPGASKMIPGQKNEKP